MTNSDAYICEPQLKADASVIWLHGLGADGRDFVDIVDQLGLPLKHSVRFIFPNAPYMPVSINNGMQMRSWYDIYDLHTLSKEDEAGIARAQQSINALIDDQIKQGIPSNRIMLVGFSQGGATALYTGLRFTQPLAGIIVLSAYLPLAGKFLANDFAANRQTPIFIAHGLFDQVVPINLGQTACKLLQQTDYSVEWNTYAMQHTVDMDEIHAIGSFMRRCLNNQGAKPRTNIMASTHQGIQLVPIKDIYYFQAEHKYVVAYHKNGQLLIDDSLDKLESEFSQEFIRIHRKTLVAIDKIVELFKDELGEHYLKLCDNSGTLKVSRRQLPKVRKLLLCM